MLLDLPIVVPAAWQSSGLLTPGAVGAA